MKASENAQELQLKYITGNQAWNNFCVCLDQRCSRERNLRDRDLVKTSRLRLHQKLRDSRLPNLSILPKFCFECCRHFRVEFFFISGFFWHVLVVSYLQMQQTKIVEFKNFTKLFLCNIQSLETCSLQDRYSQIWVSRLHHRFRHRCTLHLLQRILISPLHVKQWWSLEMWSWSRDYPFFESQFRRFEVCLGLQKYGLVKLL